MENMKKIIKIIFHNKNIDIHKTPNPIREIRVPKLFFITILSYDLFTALGEYTICVIK